MTIVALILSGLMLTPAKASEKQERKMFDDYVKYSSSPTPDELWNKVTDKQERKIYQVQKGDTLWGVSSVLFGDPEFWPKIWSLNRNIIYNPHQILPAMNLTFTAGTLTTAPTLAVEPKQEAPPIILKAAGNGPSGDQTIAVHSGKYQDIPANFPSLPILPVPAPPPDPSDIKSADHPPEAPYNLRFMITMKKFDTIGNIIEISRGNDYASIGDVVTVNSKSELTGNFVFLELVRHKRQSYNVYKYLAEGMVKEKRSDGSFAIEITKSQEPIPKDSTIIAGDIPKVSRTGKPAAGIAYYTLFSAPPESQTLMGGIHDTFFLKGDEIEVGTEYQIYSQEDKTMGTTPIAKGIVVQAADGYGTVLVTESKSGVKVGDVASSK